LSDNVLAAGLDVGFRRTGIALFRLGVEVDELIVADTIESDDNKTGTTLQDDFKACWSLDKRISEFLTVHEITGLFLEFPHGGGQGARSHRCMGMATGLMVSLLRRWNIPFEIYSPADVERSLGIFLTNPEAKALGISGKGKLGAFKKERMQERVNEAFPLFDGWPGTVELRKDAYDAAATFLAGRENNSLYAKLKEQVSE